ncbi:uncharacterized protein TRAVEDRAFT_75729 [Trametes versicolor FP-101664 SS1]|uniref:Uncharacterized protein n=1 Tax=Trametes versicolor (strain FP-101664) TaxID=717944 RepID=R7S7F6_TRAVS|nr:uncharacterized protein TRAVEDRAFT_75729 [Trametes versicolor FP-101664 SS1]EIW51542.1 hypothetical protein TRAVEDRAFT_75729 [Trametes versicolor FP-101664 SS1]
MFAHEDNLSDETCRLLDTHLRSFIIGTVIGKPRSPGLVILVPNPTASADIQVAEFTHAAASYFPPFTLPDGLDPPPVYNPPRRALQFAAASIDSKHTITTSRMSPEVLRSFTDSDIMKETQHLIWTLTYDV